MTRKQSKRAANSRLQQRRFKLTIEGQPMLVEYTPNWRQAGGDSYSAARTNRYGAFLLANMAITTTSPTWM